MRDGELIQVIYLSTQSSTPPLLLGQAPAWHTLEARNSKLWWERPRKLAFLLTPNLRYVRDGVCVYLVDIAY
jgi:hypothetical protein